MTRKYYNDPEFRKVRVTIEFSYRYKDVTKATLKEYLKEAVEVWGGQFDPGDNGTEPAPLFYGCRHVKVGAITDADPTKTIQLLLQRSRPKNVGASQVRRKRGRGRSGANSGVQTEG